MKPLKGGFVDRNAVITVSKMKLCKAECKLCHMRGRPVFYAEFTQAVDKSVKEDRDLKFFHFENQNYVLKIHTRLFMP